MASFLGTTYENTPVQSSVNLPLVQTVLAMKQGTYDANKAKLQAGLDQLSTLQVLRPQDQEYIKQRTEELTNKINDYENRDLSQSYVADDLFNVVKGVARDPFIQSAIENTTKYNNYNLQVDEIRKKKPELYSDVNYSYGLDQAGLSKYLNGESNKIGNLQYKEYADISKELKDISENLDKYANVTKEKKPNGKGYLISQDGKYLTETEVRGIAETLLSDKAKGQMQVNAWASYDVGKTDEEKLNNVTNEFVKFKNNRIENLDAQIESNKLLAKNNKNNTEYLSNITNLTKQKESFLSSFEDVMKSKDKATMYTTMYKDGVLGNFASTFAFDNVSEQWDNDTTWQAQRQMEFNKYKMDREFEYKDKELALQSAELDFKYGDGTQGSAMRKNADTLQTKIDTNNAGYEQDITNVVKDQEQLIGGYETTTKALANKMYETLSDEDKKGVDNLIKTQKLTREQAIYQLGKTSGTLFSEQDTKALGENLRNLGVEQERLLTYRKQVLKEADNAIDNNLITDLYNKPNIKIMWQADNGVLQAYSAKDMLQKFGVVDSKGNIKSDIKEHPKLFEALKQSILIDKVLSSKNDFARKIDWSLLSALAKQNGEDVNKVAQDRSEWGEPVYINPNTKTGKLLETAKRQGAYNKAGRLSADDSFDDISSSDNFINSVSSSEVDKKVAKLLMDDKSTRFNKTAIFAPKDRDFGNLNSITDGTLSDDKRPFEVTLNKSDPSIVFINKATEVKDSKGKGTGVYSLQESTKVPVRIADLPDSVKARIDLGLNKTEINFKTLPDKKFSVWFEDATDKDRVENIAMNYMSASPERAILTTRQGAKQYLFSNFKSKLGTENAPTEYGNIINKIISSPSRITAKFYKKEKGTEKVVRPELYYRDDAGNNIFLYQGDRIPENSLEASVNELEFTPQLLILKYLQSILSDPSNENLEKLKNTYGK